MYCLSYATWHLQCLSAKSVQQDSVLPGTLPTAAWRGLSELTLLGLGGNSLSGTLPTDLASACPHLIYLNFSSNNFSGAERPLRSTRQGMCRSALECCCSGHGGQGIVGVPTGRALLCKATIAGTLPVQWSSLPLRTIDVSSNRIDGVNPSSEIGRA